MRRAHEPDERAAISPSFDPISLPILGEPLPVELANTWYSDDGTMIDFLATSELVVAWFAHAPAASDHDLPTPLTSKVITSLRELRDATYALCAHVTLDARTTPTAPVVALNHLAGRAAGQLRLRWDDTAPPSSGLLHTGPPANVLVARLASEAIAFFAGADRALLRRCATPVCELFFVQRHHRRRFCSEPCSQRTRQSRYYRNHHPSSTHSSAASR